MVSLASTDLAAGWGQERLQKLGLGDVDMEATRCLLVVWTLLSVQFLPFESGVDRCETVVPLPNVKFCVARSIGRRVIRLAASGGSHSSVSLGVR
eukprot:654703-Rhodomonas_salina.1